MTTTPLQHGNILKLLLKTSKLQFTNENIMHIKSYIGIYGISLILLRLFTV